MTAPISAPQVSNMRGLSFTPTGALARYRRVRFGTDGKLAYCAASDTDCIGVTQRDSVASGLLNLQPAPVEPTNNGQFCGLIMTAVAAITAPAAVYAAANGKVDASGTVLVGLAISSSTADGDLLTVLPSAAAILGSVARSSLATDTQPYTIPLTSMLTHATMVALGSAAGTPAGDFGLTPGTFGTNTPLIVGESASGNSKSDAARVLFRLPAEYVSGGTITLRIHCRITGNVQVAQTIDASCYVADGAGSLGSDIVTTNAQTVTASMADYDFTITPTSRVAGDVLDIQITGAANDTGGTAGKLIQVGDVRVLLQVKG